MTSHREMVPISAERLELAPQAPAPLSPADLYSLLVRELLTAGVDLGSYDIRTADILKKQPDAVVLAVASWIRRAADGAS